MSDPITSQLPAEIQTQIIYQYILGSSFKHVLKLRLVSKYFDLETIRALIGTINYRPPVHLTWYPLTSHLFLADLRHTTGHGDSLLDHYHRSVVSLEEQFPKLMIAEKCYAAIAKFHAFCVPVSEVFKELRFEVLKEAKHEVVNAQNANLVIAIVCDSADVSERLWSSGQALQEETWTLLCMTAARSGAVHALPWLLALPEVTDEQKKNTVHDLVLQAAKFGQIEVIRFLNGAFSFFKNTPTQCLVPLMKHAAANGHTDVLRFAVLAKSPDPNAEVADSMQIGRVWSSKPVRLLESCIQIAVQYGQAKMLQALLDDMSLGRAAQLVLERHHIVLLMDACRCNKHQCASVILQSGGVSKDFLRQRRYQEHFARAVAHGNVEFCTVLADAGLLIYAPLFNVAIEAGQTAVLRWLLEKYMDERKTSTSMVSARSIARAAAKGYLSIVRWVMTEPGVKRIHHGEMLAPEELCDDIPRVFPGDLVLTATINSQEHVLKYLLERGMDPLRTDFIDAVQPEVGARLKDGRLPFKNDHGLILCYEDAEREENVQVWGRKVDIPVDFEQRNIFQQDRPVGAHRGMLNHIAPA